MGVQPTKKTSGSLSVAQEDDKGEAALWPSVAFLEHVADLTMQLKHLAEQQGLAKLACYLGLAHAEACERGLERTGR